MTTLKFGTYSMLAADLGKDNPNPDFKNISFVHTEYTATDKITDEEKKYLGKGIIDTILPYTIQDNYNRCRKMQEFPAAILENDFLRATFLPTLGGRLWSLYDKKLNRELLYVNSVFQPGNLAVRNAWFSGGVEWNVGVRGHNPLTCSPLFTEFAETENNEPVLRMYEFERIRRTVYSVEAYLPENEGVLYMRNTIENTSKEDQYTYWWSNMAVPKTPNTRVVAPADEAFICHYNEGSSILDKADIPYQDGVDVSYPKNIGKAIDLFYNVPQNREKWVAAVENDGKGVVQFSQKQLISRKMFTWGQSIGGTRWGEFLSEPGQGYIEIQAGLAHTQLEHIIINGGEKISWIEGYCAAVCDPERVMSTWENAQEEVKRVIASHISLDNIETCLEEKFPKTLKNRRIVQNGSGWGYIENEARKHFGKPPVSETYNFPQDSVDDKERMWLRILEGGAFDAKKPLDEPENYLTYPEWLPVIKASAEKEENWYAYLQLGVAYYACCQLNESKKALEKSNAICENPWALRNLAMIAKNEENDIQLAVKLMLRAFDIGCLNRGFLVNLAGMLYVAQMYKEWIKIYDSLSKELKADGRLSYYYAAALLKCGRAREAAEVINPDFEMNDIKESETSISQLWSEIYKELTGDDKYPIPYKLDFRMHE